LLHAKFWSLRRLILLSRVIVSFPSITVYCPVMSHNFQHWKMFYVMPYSLQKEKKCMGLHSVQTCPFLKVIFE